jgi:hypothetical protein
MTIEQAMVGRSSEYHGGSVIHSRHGGSVVHVISQRIYFTPRSQVESLLHSHCAIILVENYGL